MAALGLSHGQFARLVGVAPNTLTRAIGEKASDKRGWILSELDRLERERGAATVEIVRTDGDSTVVRVEINGRTHTLVLTGLSPADAMEAAARYVRTYEQ